MRLYRFGEILQYEGSLREAHAQAKSTYHKSLWDAVRIEEVEVKADKQGLLAALHGDPEILQVYRSWCLTPRGALVEKQPEETQHG